MDKGEDEPDTIGPEGVEKLCKDSQELIEKNSKYKVFNRDQKYNVLEFSHTICPDLSNYDQEDGACKYYCSLSLSLTGPPRVFNIFFSVRGY